MLYKTSSFFMLTTLFTLVDLVDNFSGSLELTTATETYAASIKLQDEGVYTVFLPKAIYSPALPPNQNIALVCIKPKHKIRVGSDEGAVH